MFIIQKKPGTFCVFIVDHMAASDVLLHSYRVNSSDNYIRLVNTIVVVTIVLNYLP